MILSNTLTSPKAISAAIGAPIESGVKMRAETVSVFYGAFRAVAEVSLPIRERKITAIIGPSGCGKSTLLRAFNRMNDLVAGARIEGAITLDGEDIYAAAVDAVAVRRS